MSGQIVSQPNVTATKIPQSTTVGTLAQKVLFVGQITPAATATAGALTTNVPNGESAINALLGITSQLAGSVREFRKINKKSEVAVIGLDDDGSAVKAESTITFTGPASAAGNLFFNIGSRVNHSYTITIADTDSETVIAAALVAAITADTDAPFTAANVSGVVTVTAENGGTIANAFLVESTGSVAGVGVTVTAFTGGLTDPSLTNVFDVVGDERYQTIVYPDQYGDTFVGDFLDARWNTENSILDGVGISTKVDTLANLKTAGNALNSQSLVKFGNKLEAATAYKGPSMAELDYVVSSQFAAARTLRLTDGAQIADVVASVQPKDQIGGDPIRSLPYFNTPFSLLPIVDIDKGWTQEEIEELLAASISVIGNNRSRTGVLSGEVVTTYKTDAASNPDTTFKFLNTVDEVSGANEFLWANSKKDFVQSRLTLGDVASGYSIHNENTIKAKFLQYFDTLSSDDYLLFEAGAAAKAVFEANLAIAIDLINGKVTVTEDANMISQLRTLIIITKYGFSTQ